MFSIFQGLKSNIPSQDMTLPPTLLEKNRIHLPNSLIHLLYIKMLCLCYIPTSYSSKEKFVDYLKFSVQTSKFFFNYLFYPLDSIVCVFLFRADLPHLEPSLAIELSFPHSHSPPFTISPPLVHF